MVALKHRNYFFLFLFLLVSHMAPLHAQRHSVHDRQKSGLVKSSSDKIRGDILRKDGHLPDSSSSSNNVRSRTNPWVAGNTNCTCIRELMALKRDLREEVNQRIALKSALDTYVSELYEVRGLVTALNTSRLLMDESPNSIAAMNKPTVAFSAKLSYNRELKPLDTVLFDTVLTNIADGYSPETGRFTAPVQGTYFFHATILSGYNTKVETAIIVNDKEIARMYSGAHDAHGSGSNMAVVELRAGDSVWIRLLYQGGNHVHGYYSTFSGALINTWES